MIGSQARFLLPALLVASAAVAGGGAPVDGHWRGTLAIADPPIEIILTLDAAVASVHSPSHPHLPITVVDLEIREDEVRFRLEGLPEGASFRGRLADGGKRLQGELSVTPAAVPSTDIHLVEVEPAGQGWKIVSATNVTDREGYDNQPSFLPGSDAFLYASQRDGQTDIYRYDRSTGSRRQVTRTPETSEYSPTPLPGGDGFSVVRVEPDGRQRLWAFRDDGEEPRLLLAGIEPVGYHAWLDAGAVALFILGTPPTLQIADPATGTARLVAKGIGRALQRTPGSPWIAYVRQETPEEGTILRLGPGDDSVAIGPIPSGVQDFAFLPDGRLLAGEGSKLLVLQAGGKWIPTVDLAGHGISGITRIAVHAGGRLLAVVAERPGGVTPEPVRQALTLARVEG